ncbi:hypothetical protein HOU08_gp133 [Dickeya phage vB_DsoM_JA29]|uniref:KTSC and Metallopeptidase-like N-terminal fusion domain-containing protein n=1 Tax=Dickeya phage vB_DsoM_JA29 TaxID=2283031 RepID=A0A384ZXA9_9CAUD|nr:hypothetical protein HOU08_gp133 [Dickeya phage vB_DsoM_JA29]AXG66859.1 hypothetical protein JA29_133 [Dickeya phage vB_DsoM_JA29]
MKDFTFYRYLGGEPLRSNGLEITTRDVVGVAFGDGVAYIASPKQSQVIPVAIELGNKVREDSREFTANPAKLFPENFNFDIPEANVSETPKPEIAAPIPAPTAYPSQVNKSAVPAPAPVSNETEEIANTRRAQEIQEKEHVNYKQLKPLKYANTVYGGGSINNYEVKKLEKCGKVKLEVQSYEDYLKTGLRSSISARSCPDYVMQDIQDNVMPAIGLKVPLPFKRLFIGLGLSDDGCFILNTRYNGVQYGVIILDPKQIVKLLGGFNSKSVAHVITHELAHFIDSTLLRNVDRMKFKAAIAGKDIHPIRNVAAGKNTMAMEHFATLAELMVWGDSLRKVYALNGIDVVEKYFVNRYIPDEDIESRTL